MAMGRRDSSAGSIRASFQRAGHLWKLPMSKSTSERWQKRFFVAKDGFLLYYSPSASSTAHFDTKPKGCIPLGGCAVELVERGPKGKHFGLKISHPDFVAGRVMILAAESEEDQSGWYAALQDCGRVTMSNALLGDRMIEELKSQGTAAESAREEAMKGLEETAKRLALEKDARERLEATHEEAARLKAEAEEIIAQRDAERARFEAEVAKQRQAAEDALRAKGEALKAAERAAAEAREGLVGAEEGSDAHAAAAERARSLEEERERFAREQRAMKAQIKAMAKTATDLEASLAEVSAEKGALEDKLRDLKSQKDKLRDETRERRKLERRLQIAEESVRRLDDALRRSGLSSTVEVYADVRALKSFFQDRIDQVARDASRIELVKKALKAKQRFLLGVEKAEEEEESSEEEDFDDDEDDAWDEDEEDAGAGGAGGGEGEGFKEKAAAVETPVGADGSDSGDGWGEDEDSGEDSDDDDVWGEA